MIALYAAHRDEFATLAKMVEAGCDKPLGPEAIAAASHIRPRMGVYCHYDGAMRFILGVRGLMTIGPEHVVGLAYIPGDPARKGKVVPVIGSHMQDVDYVYLRHIESRWYVFSQNSD
jgi:hypothetical protein